MKLVKLMPLVDIVDLLDLMDELWTSFDKQLMNRMTVLTDLLLVLNYENQECLKQVKEIYFEFDFFFQYVILFKQPAAMTAFFPRNENIRKICKRIQSWILFNCSEQWIKVDLSNQLHIGPRWAYLHGAGWEIQCQSRYPTPTYYAGTRTSSQKWKVPLLPPPFCCCHQGAEPCVSTGGLLLSLVGGIQC